MKKMVAGGSRIHTPIMNVYSRDIRIYAMIAKGRYINFINIPKTYPINE
jgi:hypothetical protein